MPQAFKTALQEAKSRADAAHQAEKDAKERTEQSQLELKQQRALVMQLQRDLVRCPALAGRTAGFVSNAL